MGFDWVGGTAAARLGRVHLLKKSRKVGDWQELNDLALGGNI